MKTNLCMLATVLCLACGPRCHADVWHWGYFAQPFVGETYAAMGTFGAAPESSDGYDIHDHPIYPKIAAHIGAYHENGVAGWTGPTGFWMVDYRAET